MLKESFWNFKIDLSQNLWTEHLGPGPVLAAKKLRTFEDPDPQPRFGPPVYLFLCTLTDLPNYKNNLLTLIFSSLPHLLLFGEG